MDKISFDFKGRTAIVTGGAQGFGLDITKRLIRSGASVIIWDNDQKMVEKVIEDINYSSKVIIAKILVDKQSPFLRSVVVNKGSKNNIQK